MKRAAPGGANYFTGRKCRVFLCRNTRRASAWICDPCFGKIPPELRERWTSAARDARLAGVPHTDETIAIRDEAMRELEKILTRALPDCPDSQRPKPPLTMTTKHRSRSPKTISARRSPPGTRYLAQA
jgi:hypothetical protein